MTRHPGGRGDSSVAGWQLLFCFVLIAVAVGTAMKWGMSVKAVLLIVGLAALGLTDLPSWVWAAGAIGSAMLMRVFTSSGLFPSVFDFADFGIVYVGLAVILARHGWSRVDRRTRSLLRALLFLLTAICMSWALHPSDIARPFVVFLFWAEPFALILMLVIEPPSRQQWRFLLLWLAAIAVLQIPVAVYQVQTLGSGDPVVGTLVGQSGGAHVMSGVTVLFGLALLSWGFDKSVARGLWATLLALPFIVVIPLVADAKQVVFVLPIAGAMLFLTIPGLSRKMAILVPTIMTVALLLFFVPAGQTAVKFLEEARQGRSGKLVSAEVVLREMRTDLSTLVFGLGPADGVSRAAFMTSVNLTEGSPLLALGLEPAALPARVEASAAQVAGGTSFNSPLSSALGIFGDIGLVGALAYGWVMLCTCRPLMRRPTWAGRAALAGWAMSIPLAITFDWWEQPPFMLSLALLTALAWDQQVFSRERRALGGAREVPGTSDVTNSTWVARPSDEPIGAIEPSSAIRMRAEG